MSQSDFQARRVKMVDGQLRTTDVTSHPVLDAFLAVPRESYVSDAKRELAYLDMEIAVAPGRYLMEPSPLAKLIQLAGIESTDKVLEIGTGTGYGAAILSSIGASVVALESDSELADTAKANLAAANITNVETIAGPLTTGAASKGPFNVILIEGAVAQVPKALFDQLADGGRLVAVEGEGLSGVARLYVKSGQTVSGRRGFNLSVKPLPGFELAPQFSL
jgi:protein-L-isoaspartate(D-aspartate) O-methyltransferase